MRIMCPAPSYRAFAIAGLAILAACSPAPEEVAAPMLPLQPGWTRPSEPALQAGALRSQAMWNDPSVIRDDDRYVMYATTSVGEPWKPPVLPFRLVSNDGRNWSLGPSSPLLEPVAPYASIETPSVVRFGGRWHMFFTGVHSDPEPSPMSIGHAVSDDGIRWTIDRPVLLAATGQSGDWRSYLVAEPGAVVVDDKLLVYFSAVGARSGGGPPQDQSLGVIVSSDGANFAAPQQVLKQGGLYAPEKGFAGYSSPAAVVLGGRVHLFYSVAEFRRDADPSWRQVAIHHASSPDGLTGFVEDLEPVITAHGLDWAGGEVLAPAPLADGDTLRLWFSGHVPNSQLRPLIQRGFRGPEFGIGEASIAIAKLRGSDAAPQSDQGGQQ